MSKGEEIVALREQLDRNAEQIAALRDALSRLVEVHDAMGGMCSPERIAAEEALSKKEGKNALDVALQIAAKQPKVTHRLVPSGDIMVMAGGGGGGNAVSTKEEGK